ncbi:MAG: hypothetical protein JWO87_2202 [Phycisphaerales bacterium]|jgi:hypothetical protein|nr:hypothetical protein [Phycisphaerales bacterium]MDB5300539.1 hypothetical protein [Phycisphaerales bacterium]MDB5304660.1 hypothetical protein [Phycisphaerales bacterium]
MPVSPAPRIVVDSAAMQSPSVAVIDALNSLVEAEAGSIFRFVGEGSPYLGRAGAEIRRPLQEMVERNDRHAAELAALIHNLGGEPAEPSTVRAEDQYLSYLSLKFLLPKLVDAMALMIQRYENAMRVVEGQPETRQVLERHLQEMRADLDVLKKAAGDVRNL